MLNRTQWLKFDQGFNNNSKYLQYTLKGYSAVHHLALLMCFFLQFWQWTIKTSSYFDMVSSRQMLRDFPESGSNTIKMFTVCMCFFIEPMHVWMVLTDLKWQSGAFALFFTLRSGQGLTPLVWLRCPSLYTQMYNGFAGRHVDVVWRGNMVPGRYCLPGQWQRQHELLGHRDGRAPFTKVVYVAIDMWVWKVEVTGHMFFESVPIGFTCFYHRWCNCLIKAWWKPNVIGAW